jgi:hypothetical protein
VGKPPKFKSSEQIFTAILPPGDQSAQTSKLLFRTIALGSVISGTGQNNVVDGSGAAPVQRDSVV